MKLLLEISELLEWIPEAVTDGNYNISSIKGLASLKQSTNWRFIFPGKS